MKINWRVRSTYLIGITILNAIVGLTLFLLIGGLEGSTWLIGIGVCGLVFEGGIFAIVSIFKPEIKKWWFNMDVWSDSNEKVD
jgi:hypothetical protein